MKPTYQCAERPKKLGKRHGLIMLELAASVVLVAVLLALSVKMLGWTIRERRSIDRRAAALQEAGNLLDELTTLSWNEVTVEKLQAAKLSSEAAALLPEAKLEVNLRKTDDNPAAKQIAVSIDWLGSHGQREGPVRLSGWMFSREGK